MAFFKKEKKQSGAKDNVSEAGMCELLKLFAGEQYNWPSELIISLEGSQRVNKSVNGMWCDLKHVQFPERVA